jgi:hypothetical protein
MTSWRGYPVRACCCRRQTRGWAGVICPNKDEHTDGNPEGRYSPSTRSYRCLHSHCVDFDSHAFLDWVSANGGPKHAPGLREELLARDGSDAVQTAADRGVSGQGRRSDRRGREKQLDRVEKEAGMSVLRTFRTKMRSLTCWIAARLTAVLLTHSFDTSPAIRSTRARQKRRIEASIML